MIYRWHQILKPSAALGKSFRQGAWCYKTRAVLVSNKRLLHGVSWNERSWWESWREICGEDSIFSMGRAEMFYLLYFLLIKSRRFALICKKLVQTTMQTVVIADEMKTGMYLVLYSTTSGCWSCILSKQEWRKELVIFNKKVSQWPHWTYFYVLSGFDSKKVWWRRRAALDSPMRR